MTATVPAATRLWSVQTVTGLDGLRALEAEWEDLYGRALGVTPFQSHAWVQSWWTEYGRAGGLRTVLIRRDGRLVAAAPLRLTRRGPVRVLTPLGGGQSDHHDVLLDRDCAGPAAATLAAALRELPGWDVLDLAEVRAGAGAELLAGAWPAGRRWRGRGALCQELRSGSMPELVAGLSKHTAKTVKRKLRKIEAAPIGCRTVPCADVPAAVGRLLALHEGQWAGRPMSAEHGRSRFRRHLAGAVTTMAARGQAVLTEYTYEGRVVVVDLEVVGPDFLGTYLAGFDPAMREHVDIATLMLSRAFAEVQARGLPMLSLLRGDEPYKAQWRADLARNERLLLGRSAVAAGYAGLVLLRGTLADAGRDRLPRLRQARITVRSSLDRLVSGDRRGRRDRPVPGDRRGSRGRLVPGDRRGPRGGQ
jgi:CelD/BcsL family acetyltransferase involved in cellulose biosynthesis